MDSKREEARIVAGPEVRCDGRGENAHASRIAAQLAMADSDGEEVDQTDLPELHIGDHVADRDDDDDSATMLVVGLDTLQAEAYQLGDRGPTVAEVNPAYHRDDDVVEVTFPQRTDMDVDKKRYAYPRTRLRLEQPIHERDGDEEETVDVPAWAAREALRELDNVITRTGGDNVGAADANSPLAEARSRMLDAPELKDAPDARAVVRDITEMVGREREVEVSDADPLTDTTFRARTSFREVLDEGGDA